MIKVEKNHKKHLPKAKKYVKIEYNKFPKGGAEATMSKTAEKFHFSDVGHIISHPCISKIFSCKKAYSFAAMDWQKINKGL